MAFQKKTWTDRRVEFPGRRLLKIISQSATEIVVDVFRNEGNISREGDPYSATNMNDLEQRIEDEFTRLYSEITGLNLKDQELQNALVALDTRVTNAINGGDLAPPFEYNYLISNYITNKDGGIVTTADTASAWTFYDTGHPSTGTKYGMARTWPTQTAIKRNYKLVVNISAPVSSPIIELLNASGAAVVTISNLNSTTDLSQFAGQTLYPRFRGTYGYNNGARRTINFNTLKIFKQ